MVLSLSKNTIQPSRMRLDRFRSYMESIEDPWHRYALTYVYETASRANEAAGVGSPGQKGTFTVAPSTENVGYDSYEGTEVLTIRFASLKREGRPERTIGLPLKSFDPWADYLARNFAKLDPGDKLVPFDRYKLSKLFKRYGFAEARAANSKGARKNPLRHDRINHLADYYQFGPFDLTLYSGWSLPGTSIAFGGSPTISEYAHRMWAGYFPKLCKPLPSFEPRDTMPPEADT